MTQSDDIYPGGFATLMRFLENRQRKFDDIDAILPPPDVDLTALKTRIVEAPGHELDDAERYTAHNKWVQLQADFEGQSALLHLHAMLIAISRRDNPPADALTLFFRIWDEHGYDLARELPVRWLISAATTFADCGRTGDQRALGMGLSTLFDLIKLHDSERRLSGQPGGTPFRRKPGGRSPAMPFGMPPYSLKAGDLDMVMLARLWQLCERDPTIRPLGMRMLRLVMTEKRTIFGRAYKFKPEAGG